MITLFFRLLSIYLIIGSVVSIIFLKKDEYRDHFCMFTLTWPLFLKDLFVALVKLMFKKDNEE